MADEIRPEDALFALAIIEKWFDVTAGSAEPESEKGLLRGVLDQVRIPERVLRMRHTLTTETDRGCALVAAAHLDEELEALLRAFAIDEPAAQKALDALLGPSGALGAFSVRIDLCRVLGLLRSETCRDLHLVRRIRNEFAHLSEPITFETPAVATRCAQFAHPLPGDDRTEPRQRFTSTVMALSASIEAARLRVGRRTEPPPLDRELAEKNAEEFKRIGTAIKRVLDVMWGDPGVKPETK